MDLVRSKKRVTDHGEVFTPPWLVEAMLNQLEAESVRIDSRFLEPACGSGNFLVPILRRKLATVEARYRDSDFENLHFTLLALMSIYGIELLQDNAEECRANLLNVAVGFIGSDRTDTFHRAARAVLEVNIVHGDAITMKTKSDAPEPITFAQWSYLGKGKYQRRDFLFDTLTRMASFGDEDTLFADLGSHEIFTPIRDYGSLAMSEIAGD